VKWEATALSVRKAVRMMWREDGPEGRRTPFAWYKNFRRVKETRPDAMYAVVVASEH
jgi:hypothetical protein